LLILEAKNTLTPLEMNKSDKVEFEKKNGKKVEILLKDTRIDKFEQPDNVS